jgi:hypothetical protein
MSADQHHIRHATSPMRQRVALANELCGRPICRRRLLMLHTFALLLSRFATVVAFTEADRKLIAALELDQLSRLELCLSFSNVWKHISHVLDHDSILSTVSLFFWT